MFIKFPIIVVNILKYMPKSTETRKDDMKEEVSILSPTQVSYFLALAIAAVVKKKYRDGRNRPPK